MPNIPDENACQVLLAAGVASAQPEQFQASDPSVPDVVTAIVPAGYQIQTVDVAAALAPYRHAPARVRGTATVTDTASWLAYFGKHGSKHSEVFGDVQAGTVTAVLNAPRRYEPEEGEEGPLVAPAWGDHRLVLRLQTSPAWEAWRALDGKMQSQAGFAEHVEDRAPDFHDPDAATMLETAQTIKQTTGVTFESGQRLRDGQTRFQYMETTEAKAGARGQLDVPSSFTLHLQPWRGVAIVVPVTARLRTRTTRDGLLLGYILDQVDDRMDEAWSMLLAELTDTLPVPVLAGLAPDYAGAR
jgi:uncharacterized protein YfdQ (DUF2303 family)